MRPLHNFRDKSARKILFAAAEVSSWEEFERRELTDHTG